MVFCHQASGLQALMVSSLIAPSWKDTLEASPYATFGSHLWLTRKGCWNMLNSEAHSRFRYIMQAILVECFSAVFVHIGWVLVVSWNQWCIICAWSKPTILAQIFKSLSLEPAATHGDLPQLFKWYGVLKWTSKWPLQNHLKIAFIWSSLKTSYKTKHFSK